MICTCGRAHCQYADMGMTPCPPLPGDPWPEIQGAMARAYGQELDTRIERLILGTDEPDDPSDA